MFAGGKSVFLMRPVIKAGISVSSAGLQGTVINAEKQTAAYISRVQHVANKIKCNNFSFVCGYFSSDYSLFWYNPVSGEAMWSSSTLQI